MRPKVVILTLAVAFSLLGMVVVLKVLTGKSAGDAGGPAAGSATDSNSVSGAANAGNTQTAGGSGAVPVVTDEMRAAIIDKETEQIQELVGEADGTNNPVIISALIGKLDSPEDAVRKAALAALVQLNDTNAVPGLQQAEDKVQDPRTKVAILDTINYLNLPDAMPAVQPPGTYSNAVGPLPQNLHMNPKFLHTNPAVLYRQNGGQ